ncbi:MAG: hypothetical protein LBP59_02060 [Planctomycetaceae bacterium]|jgi:hypothetical protein|nr:hypothetical protein [Planctomycetaceae bacterium]
MKLFISFIVILTLSSNIIFAQPVPQQAIPVISSIGKPKDKALDEKLKVLRNKIQELTPELKSTDWINLSQNTSPENFKTICQVLTKYENELQSNLSKTNILYAKYLQSEYVNTWNILSKYAQNDKYCDNIKQLWQKIIKNINDACCIELLRTCYYPNTKKYATPNDLVQIKKRSWDFIEKTPDIYLLDSFCHTLMSHNRLIQKMLGDADDLKRLERLKGRIDMSNPAGKRAAEVANYTCNIIRAYMDPSYGTPSWYINPLTFEELIELGELRYLSDEELAKRAKEQADAKAMLEAKLKNVTKLVTTENGRLEIIRAINSANETQEVKRTYYLTLLKYYVAKYSAIYSRHNELQFIHHDDVVTPNEIIALRELLQSKDQTIKSHALQFIEVAKIRDCLPDLLVLAAEKEQIPDNTLIAVPSVPDPNFKPRNYHFMVYRLLGTLGNQRTIKSLEQLRQSNKISKEAKDDAELAIEYIKKNLDWQKQSKQYWLNLRRDVREGKVMTSGGRLIDIDKPDPEPVSAEGYRKWETADGLFKVTAKFVGLVEIKKRVGRIADKDVQLLRNDNKTVSIELSALRLIDREYIRQQLEPERQWSTIDGNLKIKAKLIGKFDKEIIIQESDGINTTLKIDSLSEPDKNYLKQIPLSPHSKYAF